LLAAGFPVRVGPHAFDLLIALVERSGRLVTKDELLERVWPKVIVEENTLQAHISALRKILGSDAIATISRRGYRFTPEVTPVGVTATTPTPKPRHNLPLQVTSFIGREKEIAELDAHPTMLPQRVPGVASVLTLYKMYGGCRRSCPALKTGKRFTCVEVM
jgi:non-specific serine/threonine protein kinase